MHRQERQIGPYYGNLRNFLHDLAQPLSTVTGLIDLMLLELDERDKMFQEIQLISQQLEKVMEIVADIRGMALEAANRESEAQGPPQAPLS
jgi:hypothetical protein